MADGVGSGRAHGVTRRVTATMTRPADGTAYAAGDIIANSTTAASVVPITFDGAARTNKGSGRLTGIRCVVTPASGSLVIANFAFDLLVFRPATNIPFAAAGYPADNAALTVSAAALRELVGIFRFTASNWRSPAGSKSVAGVAGYQAVGLGDASATDIVVRPYAPFDLSNLSSTDDLLGLVQAQAAWTPGAVANQFDFVLDIEGN
jgi:hypothetical protein